VNDVYFARRDDEGKLVPPPGLAAPVADEPFWPRAEFVEVMMRQHGQTADHWNATYDQIEAGKT